jgi:hypothetical protein
VELPRDVFMNYRNENMRTNFLTEIKKMFPSRAAEFDGQSLQVIQQFVNQHNAKITGENPMLAQ